MISYSFGHPQAVPRLAVLSGPTKHRPDGISILPGADCRYPSQDGDLRAGPGSARKAKVRLCTHKLIDLLQAPHAACLPGHPPYQAPCCRISLVSAKYMHACMDVCRVADRVSRRSRVVIGNCWRLVRLQFGNLNVASGRGYRSVGCGR